MSRFSARNRPVLLAYLGMILLLSVTALFSPGFLSESNLRSTLILAAFKKFVFCQCSQIFIIRITQKDLARGGPVHRQD